MSDEMKQELGGLKNDLARVKADVSGLKADVIDLKVLARNTAKSVSRLTGDVADMKRDMMTKDHFSLLMKRMDGFADMFQESRWDWGKQKVRLDQHEKRISALESKRI